MKNEIGSVQPLQGYVLVEIVELEETTESGIIITEQARGGKLKFGRVISVGPMVPRDGFDSHTQPTVGDHVLFAEGAERLVEVSSDNYLVPFQAILATRGAAVPNTYPIPISTFFKLPEWEDFKGADYSAWEKYTDLTYFRIKVDFLEPFRELGPLGRRLHECIVEAIRGVDGLELSSIEYADRDDDLVTYVRDDVWSAALRVDKQNSFIELQETETSVHALHTTLPRLLTGFRNTLASPEFSAIANDDFSRVKSVVFRFHQRIKLQGRGARLQDVNNSELMQQFLLFAQQGSKRATLDALGVQSSDIGRIDMKVSFGKDIGGHDYRVFMNVQAPANDDHTLIDVEWEIQDHTPGVIPDRDYTPVFTTFLRDIVLRTFYKRWFQENDDIVCSTAKR